MAPSTRQAIVYTKNGGLEVIEQATLPYPEQKPDELVIKVRSRAIFTGILNQLICLQVVWGGVNSIDTYFR